MFKYITKLLISWFLISMITTGCGRVPKQVNSNDLNEITKVEIIDTYEKNQIVIDNKEELQVFIDALSTSKPIENPVTELKHPQFIVSIIYKGNKPEEFFLYGGMMIGNGNAKSARLTDKSVLEINKLIEKHAKK